MGLYLAPPAKAVVLCVDGKSQIQALDRTQPGQPMKKGRAGTMTHDYKRHGTTTLFAGLNVKTGEVKWRPKKPGAAVLVITATNEVGSSSEQIVVTVVQGATGCCCTSVDGSALGTLGLGWLVLQLLRRRRVI